MTGHWLAQFFGTENASGTGYLWWSGTGSDLGELALLGVLLGVVRRLNCHEPRCWRWGHLPVPGTAWHACRRHHPAPPTAGTLHDHYRLYLGEKRGRG